MGLQAIVKGEGMNKRLVFLAFAALGDTGCETPKDWMATGGSRSDGTVKLSYQLGPFERPVVNNQQGLELATSKCQAWGYTNAEAFGGATRTCNNFTSSGCNSWLVTAEYQCLGSPSK